MTNQEILDNAPQGATHYGDDFYYLRENEKSYDVHMDGEYWTEEELAGYSNIRSLADIKRIAELEKELSHAITEGDKQQAITNLRQQAEGVEDVIEDFADNDAATVIYVGDLVSRAEYLKKQADELEQS